MASNWSLCGVCDNRQITKTSVVWCSECDEGLCDDCKEHHRVFKGTKNHETVSIAEYKKLPTDVMQNAQVCKLHNEKCEFSCREHDCPCCNKCVKSHNECKGLTDINELIKNVKTSNAFYEMEQSLLEVVENVKRLRANRKDNLNSLQDKKREIEAEIKQTRTKINDHLDKLQNDLMKELMAVEQKESSKIEKLLTTLKKKEKEITEIQENIASIKQHASELQTFLTMKDIEKCIAVEEKFIQTITTSDTTNQVNISCQINRSLYQITASVQKFGEVGVSSDPCDFSIQKKKNRQAQIMIALSTKTIENLNLTLKQDLSTKLLNVRGCSLLPGGRMVFSSFRQSEIIVLKSDGSKDFRVDKIRDAFDVVFIGDGNIAVTSSQSNKIYIIDLRKQKLKKSIKEHYVTHGAVYKDGNLIYCVGSNGIKMIRLSDESIIKVIRNQLMRFAYVAAFGNKLVYTNPGDHIVFCCDKHGKLLWRFSDTNVLKYPLGVSVDNDGNVFVVGYLTNNVVVISPDGKRYRKLLSSKNRLDIPQVLHYDTSTNKLLVANENHNAFLYEVK